MPTTQSRGAARWMRMPRLRLKPALTLLVAAAIGGCGSVAEPEPTAQQSLTETRIDAKRLADHVSMLASDSFEGRSPGSAGERRTVNYLIQQFSALGLQPGGVNGAWTQDVPLVHTQLATGAMASFTFAGPASARLQQGRDFAIETTRAVERVLIEDAPVVFVGYGVYAPERQWDDFGPIDLRGKVAVFLVNDPDFYADSQEPVAGVFGNRRMTYYGRWTYKFEEAARRGAVAALVVHDTRAAGYGWNVASSSPGESFALVPAEGATPAVALQGWLHADAAESLFARAGYALADLMKRARTAQFNAFELPDVRFSADLPVRLRQIRSQNVLARLPGSERAEETLMLSAHWDAYGTGEPDAEGRTVRPGANDDALGTAGVLELARVLKSAPPLQRSVVFALWTAEESGLLGSKAYASQPVYPLGRTVANLTLDILQTAGPAHDVILVGEGQSELERYLAEAAAAQGRRVTPESLPENGLFFRADHFSLAREGVPVLLLMGIAGAADLVDGGQAAGARWIEDYIGNCYHQTCDLIDDRWDLRGAVQDIELYLNIVKRLGNSAQWPSWYPGSEFKAERDESAADRTDAVL